MLGSILRLTIWVLQQEILYHSVDIFRAKEEVQGGRTRQEVGIRLLVGYRQGEEEIQLNSMVKYNKENTKRLQGYESRENDTSIIIKI